MFFFMHAGHYIIQMVDAYRRRGDEGTDINTSCIRGEAEDISETSTQITYVQLTEHDIQ